MRTITKKAIEKFYNAESFKSSNTKVIVLPNVTILTLFDNEIAYLYNDPCKTLSITTCGWNGTTTKERLNGLNGVQLSTKKGVLYLNGIEWNGKLTNI
jgi:hypothetical protein